MTLSEIGSLVEFLSNKDQSGLVLTPERRNTLFKEANRRVFLRKYGLPENEMSPQFFKVAYDKSQKIHDDLRPFIYSMGAPGSGVGAPTVSPTGVMSIPSDYLHISSCRYRTTVSGVTRMVPVDIITEPELGDRFDDPLTEPTLEDPVLVIYDYIQFYPSNVAAHGSMQFTYLRKPLDPLLDYYINNTTGQIIDLAAGETPPATGVTYSGLGGVANISATVELEWPETAHGEIVSEILSLLSINIKDGELINLIEMKRRAG